jgi:hypothetical protein
MKSGRQRWLWMLGALAVAALCVVGAAAELRHLTSSGIVAGCLLGGSSAGALLLGEVIRRRKKAAVHWLQPVGVLPLVLVRFEPSLDHVFGFAGALAIGTWALGGAVIMILETEKEGNGDSRFVP